MNKGTFCISLDTELLWGRHDFNYHPFITRAQRTRPVIKSLLLMFEKYNISATWAIVGHLFLDQCSSKNSIKHPEIIRPNYPWRKVDWFLYDPATSIKDNPEWYGKDIVQLIKKSKKQEIGSHSFSHVLIGHSGCSKKCAESEIKECIKLASKEHIKLKSFVFPCNLIGQLKLLHKLGFKSFRGLDSFTTQASRFKLVNKLLLLIDLLLLIPHTSNPHIEEGLVNIPGNMYYLSARGFRRFIPINLRVMKAKFSIQQAIRKHQVFHLWFHPIDLTDNSIQLLKGLEEIIKYAAIQNKKGLLNIKSMNEIAVEVLN